MQSIGPCFQFTGRFFCSQVKIGTAGGRRATVTSVPLFQGNFFILGSSSKKCGNLYKFGFCCGGQMRLNLLGRLTVMQSFQCLNLNFLLHHCFTYFLPSPPFCPPTLTSGQPSSTLPNSLKNEWAP